jgi:hypothetical protein
MRYPVSNCRFSIFLTFLLLTTFCCRLDAGNDSTPSAITSRGKTVILLTKAEKIRVIDTYPYDTLRNTRKALENFRIRELTPSSGKVKIEIDAPVIIEEYPYSGFVVKSNKAFGAQLAGQVNPLLSRSQYRSSDDFNRRQEKIFEILSLAGVGIARDFGSYDTRRFLVEPRKGFFQFSNTDFLTQIAHKHDIDIIARLSIHDQPFKEGPPEDRNAYLNYIRKTVQRYNGDGNTGCSLAPPDCYTKGDKQYPVTNDDIEQWAKIHRIRYWETVKEPEPRRRNRIGNDPGLTPREVKDIFQMSYETIKSVDKTALVFFGGMGPLTDSHDLNEQLAKEKSYFSNILSTGGGEYFDILGVSAFLYDTQEISREYKEMAKKYGYQKPLWISQAGASMQKTMLPFGGSHQKQSEYMVKAFARAFATGVKKVFWGDFLDNSKAENRQANLWDSTGLFYTETWGLKPAYFTYKLLAAVLLDFNKAEEVSGNIFKFYFQERSTVYIAWP